MSAHPADLLSPFLDGDLDPATHAAVEAHLAGCAECRAIVDDLRILGDAAAAWGTAAVEPSSDLWPSIAARLTGPRDAASPASVGAPFPIAAPHSPWYRRRWTLGVPELALAASLAAAVGGALAWQRTPPPAPAAPEPVPVVAQLESLEPDDAAVTPVNFADPQYDAAVVDLERVLREQRERLDPRTVVVLERNLRVIDDAIAEAREALATDPANALLNAHLAGARQRKLDLLRRAALITGGD